MLHTLSKINFCIKSITWVSLFIVKKNQKETKTNHHSSESSPLTGAGVSQAAVSSFQGLWICQAEMKGEIEEMKIQAGSKFVVTRDCVLVFSQRLLFGQFFQAVAAKYHLVTVGMHPLPHIPWQSTTILQFCRIFRLPSVSVVLRFRQSDELMFKEATKEAEVIFQRLMCSEVAW